MIKFFVAVKIFKSDMLRKTYDLFSKASNRVLNEKYMRGLGDLVKC